MKHASMVYFGMWENTYSPVAQLVEQVAVPSLKGEASFSGE
ncbi:MAG: hypothetical protein AABY43_05185 [Candidatus Omnitrophota bacterium]